MAVLTKSPYSANIVQHKC